MGRLLALARMSIGGFGLWNRDLEVHPPAAIAGLLDNRVLGGQIGRVGWCEKARLVGAGSLANAKDKT